MIRPDVPCFDVVERTTAFIERVLPEDEAIEVELHLVTCPSCRDYLDQMRQTIALTGRLLDEPVPAELEEALLAAFRAVRGDR